MTRMGETLVAVGTAGPLASAAVRVWTFTVVLAGVAGLGYLLRIQSLQPLDVPFVLPWPILAVGFFLADLKVIEVHFRRETHAFSLSEMPAVIGLFFVPPEQYLLALLLGSAAALLITSRQSAVKTAFNLANYVLVAVVAIIIFRTFGRFAGLPGPQDWVAAFVAMLVASAIGALDIATAIREARSLRIDKRNVHLPEPIKNVGTYMVVVEVNDDVTATVKTMVVAA